jgi:hypothetical protein
MLDLQAAVGRYDELVAQRDAPPLLPDGTYTLAVTKAEAGSDHIYVHMLAHTGEQTRVRLMFTTNAMSVTFAHLAGFGIGRAEMPEALADLAPMLVGRTVQAELGHYEGSEHTFQQIKVGTVALVAS